MAGPVADMAGRVVGILTITARAGADPQGRAIWECMCQCGRRTLKRGDHLRRGTVKSCGECGAFHPQGLTSANAKYLINTYTANRASQGINSFGAAFEPETGRLMFTPRKPTYVPAPLASVLQQLAAHGLIRAKENRTTVARWALEERCVLTQQFAFDGEKALHAAWTELTGELVDEVYVPPADERKVTPIPELSHDARVGFMAYLAQSTGDDYATDY